MLSAAVTYVLRWRAAAAVDRLQAQARLATVTTKEVGVPCVDVRWRDVCGRAAVCARAMHGKQSSSGDEMVTVPSVYITHVMYTLFTPVTSSSLINAQG